MTSRRIDLVEDINLEQASTFQLSSLDDFIISFERLSKQRILAIVGDYGEEVMDTVLKILMVDPGGFNITRDAKIVPRSDTDILRNVKAVDKLYDAFTALYERIINSYDKISQEREKNVDALQQENSEIRDAQMPQNENVEISNCVLNVAGIDINRNLVEAIKIKEAHKAEDGNTYKVVINNIDEYDTLLDIEDIICEKLNITNVNCEFIYETIKKNKYNATIAESKGLCKRNALSGLVEVFIPTADQAVITNDDNLLDSITYEVEIQKQIIENCDATPNYSKYLDGICEEYHIVLSDGKYQEILSETKDNIIPFKDAIAESNIINSGISQSKYEIDTAQGIFEAYETLQDYFSIIENNECGTPRELWESNPIMYGESDGNGVKFVVLHSKENTEVVFDEKTIIAENLKQLDSAIENDKIGNYLYNAGITQTDFVDNEDIRNVVIESFGRKSLTSLHKVYYKNIYENLDKSINSNSLRNSLEEGLSGVTSKGFIAVYEKIVGLKIKDNDLFYESKAILKQDILDAFSNLSKEVQEQKITELSNIIL